MECILCGPSVGWNLVIRGWWWPLTILISIISTWYQYDIGMVLVMYLKDITSWGSKIILGAIQKKCANFSNLRKLELWWSPLTKNWEKSEIDTIWSGCIPFAPEFNKILVKVLASKTFVQSQSCLTIWSFFFSRLLTFSTPFELESLDGYK